MKSFVSILFLFGGRAYVGFERICRPLTIDHYKNLREFAPELLGLKSENG